MTQKTKKKEVRFRGKKTVILFFLFLMLSFSPIRAPKADAWMAVPAATLKQLWEELHERIMGMMLGMLKQQAVIILNEQINGIIQGTSSSSAMFIVDWESFLIREPENMARIYMNDYLSQMTAGRGSASGYVSEGFLPSGGNYANQLVNMAKSTISETAPRLTYEGDPSQMFASGNFRNLTLYLSGINNPWAFRMAAENAYQRKLSELSFIRQEQGEAYDGFKGTVDEETGMIINPGSLIKENVANVQDLGNKVLASATHPEEMITAFVSQMITRSMQQGIGEVQRNIEREAGNVADRAFSAVSDQVRSSGPGAVYSSENKDLWESSEWSGF